MIDSPQELEELASVAFKWRENGEMVGFVLYFPEGVKTLKELAMYYKDSGSYPVNFPAYVQNELDRYLLKETD